MGFMCNGKPLEAHYPFFTAPERKAAVASQYSVQTVQEEPVCEDEELSDNDDDGLYDEE
jgi:hypothetical protein